MFFNNLLRTGLVPQVVLLLACTGCESLKHEEVESSSSRLVVDGGAVFPLPFLAGQRLDVTQGNNNADLRQTHRFSGTLRYGVDFSVHVSPGGSAGGIGRGIPIVAVMDGVVSEARSGIKDSRQGKNESCNYGWGNSVVYCTAFRSDICIRAGHLREVFVGLGENIRAGQVIGLLGNSGASSGSHVHSQRLDDGLCPRSSSEKDSCGDSSAYVQYRYVATSNQNEPSIEAFEDNPWSLQENVGFDYDSPHILSTNEGLMKDKTLNITPNVIGVVTLPRAIGDLGVNEGWGGYGWWKAYVPCNDTDGDSETTCIKNEGQYRNNAYIRRFTGGSYGSSIVVYDALSGSTSAYLIHSGFLTDSGNGWDIRRNSTPASGIDIGMPISDQYQTSYGTRQDFQWGWLKWDASNSLVTARRYGAEINFRRSVGPGVFAPNSSINEYHWNRQISYRFVDAWNLHSGYTGVGEPYSDSNSGAGVHGWSGTRFWVQNFTSPVYGESAIIYDPANGIYAVTPGMQIPVGGWNKAYLIRGNFWNWYRYNNGMGQLKAPVSNEYAISGGMRQDFLCGRMEFNSGTGEVSHVINTELQSCKIPDSQESTSPGSCYVAGNVPPSSGNGIGGGDSSGMIIDCRVGPTDMTVFVTGPIQDGLFSTMYQDGTFIEYGSDTDGWAPYTSGKPKNTWIGDWITAEVPRTYMFTLGSNVQNMNFFMYDPTTSAVSWFDLDKWTITGDCWRDGGGIRHSVPPTVTKTLACAVNGANMTVTFTGPMGEGVFGNPPADYPTYLEYGSSTDGWAPYTTGKPIQTFASWSNSHTMLMSSNVQNMNFFLYGPFSGQVNWFDLDKWTITGACWRDGGGIRHSMPPTMPKNIDCQVAGPDMTVTVTGPIDQGIFGLPPTDNPTYIEYGSDSDGWGPYTTGKPKATWFNWLNAHTFIMSASVQNMNFFMYGPLSGQVSWFDLNQWTITGRCWRDGGGIRHN